MSRIAAVASVLSLLAVASPIGLRSREALPRVDVQTVAATKPGDDPMPGVWRAPAGATQIPIWPGSPPDGTFRPQSPESVQTFKEPPEFGGKSEAVLNIAIPTMTIMPPKGRNTGTAIIVFPGGGFQKVFITLEGTEICDWLTAKGITCIVSKYRAPGGNDFWDDALKRQITPKILRALQDAQRTIRLVRSQAGALNVDPGRIGVMGFSAGGYLVAQTSNILAPAYKPVARSIGSAAAPTSPSHFTPAISAATAASSTPDCR
jgi:acetyl esterase/lipase